MEKYFIRDVTWVFMLITAVCAEPPRKKPHPNGIWSSLDLDQDSASDTSSGADYDYSLEYTDDLPVQEDSITSHCQITDMIEMVPASVCMEYCQGGRNVDGITAIGICINHICVCVSQDVNTAMAPDPATQEHNSNHRFNLRRFSSDVCEILLSKSNPPRKLPRLDGNFLTLDIESDEESDTDHYAYNYDLNYEDDLPDAPVAESVTTHCQIPNIIDMVPATQCMEYCQGGGNVNYGIPSIGVCIDYVCICINQAATAASIPQSTPTSALFYHIEDNVPVNPNRFNLRLTRRYSEDMCLFERLNVHRRRDSV
ncbi:hypothetical protein QAD02_009344 [Eretmocerus hayati]|uniref:Uncharacterized protein n=1 Tax=Eretmocerus hayati TaxID=131215 RepID=A0ACC2N9U8_9HYME|nr:hypothetical protein QAD02_009344 [Eretmocerus hayati]